MVANSDTSESDDIAQHPEIRFAITMTRSFPILALSGFVDTLRHAADDDNRSQQCYCAWDICGQDRMPVTSSAGIAVTPECSFEDLPETDYLVVIGGLMSSIDDTPPKLLDFIRSYYHSGGKVVGLCTGSFILAQAGLLSGRSAVIHHRHRRDFLLRYSDVHVTSRDIFIESERLITCPGGTASIDLAISLLSRKLGQQRARKGLVEMSIDRFRSGTEMAMTPLSKYEFARDTRVRTAIQLMRENLSDNLEIETIAESIGVSVSQLGRIFQNTTNQSPARFRRLLQLQHARWLLTNSTQSLTRISMEAGFSEASHFSRVFSKNYGMSPKKFRLKHLE